MTDSGAWTVGVPSVVKVGEAIFLRLWEVDFSFETQKAGVGEIVRSAEIVIDTFYNSTPS